MGQAAIAGMGTFVAALILVRLLAGRHLAHLVLDVPNDRSLHDRPIPRTGGIGLMIAAAVALGLLGAEPRTIVWPAMLLTIAFIIDDVHGLSVGRRFAAQLLVATWFVAVTGPYPWLLWPLLVLGIVWSINLYNFMDGSNGLAGGMTVIGFAAYTIAAAQAGSGDLALLSAVIAGAAAGFLVWNFDPARIFLGDAGSIPLGFMAAAIGVLGWQRGIWPFWFPALVFATFIVDSGLTLAKRLVHRENPFQAHRSHYYQRLIRMGWSHARLAVSAYALMLGCAALALVLRGAATGWVIAGLAVAVLVMAGLALAVDLNWRRSPVRGT